MNVSWVIGAGGLIGSHILRRLSTDSESVRFVPADKLSWSLPATLHDQLRSQFQNFEDGLRGARTWVIYWAAGSGTFRSQEADLLAETRALEVLLECVAGSRVMRDREGGFVFSSSAGAVYAGAGADVITEDTEVAPISAYGFAKLKQENLVRALIGDLPGARVLLARISTVYGAGQASGKPQGLITHIARSLLRNRPVNIFVPLDTVRDYIAVQDAAAEMVAKCRLGVQPGDVAVRLVASERPTTIAEIVSVFRRLSRRATLILTSAEPVGSLYARCQRFRSCWPAAHPLTGRRGLVEGIAALIAEERLRFATAKQVAP